MVPHVWPMMIAAIAVVIFVSALVSYRRRSAIQQFAFEHGFEYRKSGTADLLGVKEASFYNRYNFYRNIVSGTFWAGTLGEAGSVREAGGPAAPIPFIYFEQSTNRYNDRQVIESFVRFQVPEKHAGISTNFTPFEKMYYSTERLDNNIFVWEEGKCCPAEAIGDFLRSAYFACRGLIEW